jgi:hypothetical protein
MVAGCLNGRGLLNIFNQVLSVKRNLAEENGANFRFACGEPEKLAPFNTCS